MQASKQGYREVFITYPAFGDQLLLLYASKIHYAVTGSKLLLGTTMPELFLHQYSCDIIDNLSALTVARMFAELAKAGIKVFPVTYYQPQRCSNGQLRFGFPSRHILAEMCARMGVSGEIHIDPVFELTDEEKAFGRFFSDKQIAVMSQGKEKRKNWGVENMQTIVAAFKDNYNFVQIGLPSDVRLTGALDKRGAFSIRKVAALLHNSDLFIGGIGALMHLARGVACPAVITYSLSEPLWADSYPCNFNVITKKACVACHISMINPYNEDNECRDNFSCIRTISISDVCTAVVEMINTSISNKYLEIESTIISSCQAQALNAMTARLFAMAQSSNYLHEYTIRQ
jgi:CDP-glycerol glycerophosphotransferase